MASEEGGGIAAAQLPMGSLLAIDGQDYLNESEETTRAIWKPVMLSHIIRPISLWRVETYQC
jgi:hypothetical protein